MAKADATLVVVGLVVASGIAALAIWNLSAVDSLSDNAAVVLATGFALVFLAAQRTGFRLRWRGHATRISMEEFALVAGVILLPPTLLVASVAASTFVNQLLLRRPLQKAAFNVAQYTLAASAAAAIFVGLVQLGVSVMWSAVPAPFAFSLVSHAAVAGLFARLDGVNVVQVFLDRFLVWSLVAASIGVSIGMSAYSLWALTPIAALAILPIFALLARFGRLTEWAEEEARLHQTLAATITRVAQTGDLNEGANAIVETTAQILGASEVRLCIPLGKGAPQQWVWSDAKGGSGPSIRATVAAREDEPGDLHAFPRHGHRPFGARQRHLLSLIAASAASAARTHDAMLVIKETNRRLTNANREMEEFTLWTTHDMREPLRSVGQLAQILRDDLDQLGAEEIQELATRIQGGAEGLKERIKALHEFSRIVQQDIPFENADLTPVVKEAVAGLSARIEESNARVTTPDHLPLARAQAVRLEKVFANLLENSLKYNDTPEPHVTIACEDHGDELELSVRDNGPGIEPAMRERVFQLFQRGTAARGSGSGAGLAIVKRIIEQHGGRVWITDAPEGGADVRFTLPKPTALAAPATGLASS